MNWYYVSNGEQAGPVDEAKLDELVRSGAVLFDTLIWREGMDNWQPYGQVHVPPAPPTATMVPPVATAVAAPPVASVPPEGAVCSECGRLFALDQVIRYGNRHVCAACKPIFVQRLREGGPLASPTSGAFNGLAGRSVTEEELLARDYQVDIGACLSRGWEVFKGNAGMIIGASIVVYLCMMATGIVPYLGIVASLILKGPLLAGLWLFYIKNVRNQPAVIGDAFGGFSPRFWQFVLAQLIPGLIAIGMFMMIGLAAGLGIPALAARRGGAAASTTPAAAGGFMILIGVGVLATVVVLLYLSTCWLFALPLVGDKGMKFWPAMQLSRRVVCKHWWMTFWLLMVSWLLAMAGLLALCFGVVVTGPVAFATITCHYEKVFGDLTPNQS